MAGRPACTRYCSFISIFGLICVVALQISFLFFAADKTIRNPSARKSFSLRKRLEGDAARLAAESLGWSADEISVALLGTYGGSSKKRAYVGDLDLVKHYSTKIHELRSIKGYINTVPADEELESLGHKCLNALAVFPSHENKDIVYPRMHGMIGNSTLWQPAAMPLPLTALSKDASDEALKIGGGFYSNLSNALPLDRDPDDAREEVCRNEVYDIDHLDDVSIIFVFYNEHLSMLLRSLHSVLNYTPPQLLRQIILVDDGSTNEDLLPRGSLYQYINYLPKVSIMRFADRRGIVPSRLSGIRAAKAQSIVVLDSHIEVNMGWLQPLLVRVLESPKSLVFPRIDVLDASTYEYKKDQGIGCWLTFKWVIQERSTVSPPVNSVDPVPSPSMAGGLFAVKRDTFWNFGGYDAEFRSWGAENVEMGFRYWQCGGRIECTPCSRVFHAYRNKNFAGYKVDSDTLMLNRLRTAKVWMGEFYPVVTATLGATKDKDIGDISAMLDLKRRLDCKSFSWYLQNVDPTRKVQKISDIVAVGEIRSVKKTNMCIDSLQHAEEGEPYGVFWCHGTGITQSFMVLRSGGLRMAEDESRCLWVDGNLRDCNKIDPDWNLTLDPIIGAAEEEWMGTISYRPTAANQSKNKEVTCLTLIEGEKQVVKFLPCVEEGVSDNELQKWRLKGFLLSDSLRLSVE